MSKRRGQTRKSSHKPISRTASNTGADRGRYAQQTPGPQGSLPMQPAPVSAPPDQRSPGEPEKVGVLTRFGMGPTIVGTTVATAVGGVLSPIAINAVQRWIPPASHQERYLPSPSYLPPGPSYSFDEQTWPVADPVGLASQVALIIEQTAKMGIPDAYKGWWLIQQVLWVTDAATAERVCQDERLLRTVPALADLLAVYRVRTVFPDPRPMPPVFARYRQDPEKFLADWNRMNGMPVPDPAVGGPESARQ